MASFGDNFNRADENPLSGGGNWTAQGAGRDHQIVSNAVEATAIGSGKESCVTTGITGTSKNFAWCRVGTLTGNVSGNNVGVYLRAADPGTRSFYRFSADNPTTKGSFITIAAAGSDTDLATETSTSWASGDIVEARALDTNLELWRNGTKLLSTTDATYSSGRQGIKVFASTDLSEAVLDDFYGGDMPAFTIGSGIGGWRSMIG